jgi:pyruvate dehydrogenase E2 component (dihydrolipoamide acetyltransferase)
MTEGTIARWKKAEGEAFSSGDVLCEVETDKASMDYEAPRTGVLLKIVVAAGGKASVGDTIAIIGKAGENPETLLGQAASQKPSVEPSPKLANEPVPKSVTVAPASPNPAPIPARNLGAAPTAPAGSPKSSPLARKIALELGIDIRRARGTGPEGRVTERDVRALQAGKEAVTPNFAAPVSATVSYSRPAPTSETVSGKRAVIARRLSESFFSAPHYYLKKEILADRLVESRSRTNEGRDKPVSLNAILMKLVAAALTRHPELNVSWQGERIEKREVIDIALAVALPDGLITPVVRDCPYKGVELIDAELSALIEKARTKGLAPDEYEGAGFTITNLGSYGIDEFTAIINPPGSAILAVGAIRKKPIVMADDSIGIAKTMVLTLGCDHRTVDGATGARFLADLASMLEDPFKALL